MEQKNNSGVLFKNSNKKQDNHPDYVGNSMVNGKEMQIAVWYKQSQKGVPYFSLAFSEPKEKQQQQPKVAPNNFKVEDDGLPF